MEDRTPRVDAVRNREAILRSADELLTGTGDVTTEAIARHAGVGKATLFRGFGDRAGLLREVYERRVADLLARAAGGPPPLGPGGPAAARIPAVLDAILTFKIENRGLSRALELVSSHSPYSGRHYEGWHELLTGEFHRLGLRRTATYYADVALAAVRSDLIEHQLSVRGLSPDTVRGDLRRYATRLVSTM